LVSKLKENLPSGEKLNRLQQNQTRKVLFSLYRFILISEALVLSLEKVAYTAKKILGFRKISKGIGIISSSYRDERKLWKKCS